MFTVDNKPFFSLGGQLHNSTSYRRDDMDKAISALKLINANTMASPVMWEVFEKTEGCYDYEQIDMLVDVARKNDLKLIVLWFGSWKNGMSHYLPQWIKRDKRRFCFVRSSQGEIIRNISALCAEAQAADQRAFCALMDHIRKIDEEQKTVLAVQVENEPGIIGCARDHSPLGEELFAKPVPCELLKMLPETSSAYADWKKHDLVEGGCWEKTFGMYADEYFTAFHTAKYIEKIAKCGKEIYNIPLYTNVWLQDMYWGIPGASYPSGGPVERTLDIWKLLTPSLFAIAPDIYVSNMNRYNHICKSYSRSDNPLYIPESYPANSNTYSMFRAVADYGTIGFHTFAVDTLVGEDGKPNELECGPFIESMRTLSYAIPLLENPRGQMVAVVQEEFTAQQLVDFGDYVGMVKFYRPNANQSAIDHTAGPFDTFHRVADPTELSKLAVRGRGLINYRGNGEFFLTGSGYRLLLARKRELSLMNSNLSANEWMLTRHWEYLSVEEGRLDRMMNWHPSRVRNGDETDGGAWVAGDVGLVRIIMDSEG